jgi:hypothetical protein
MTAQTVEKTVARRGAYFTVAHVVFEDPRYAEIVSDPVKGWAWARMAHTADRAWPGHPSLPRWAEQPTLDALVAVGLIELLPNDEYAIPGLDTLRARASESAIKAGKLSAESAVRDDRGHFLPRSQPTPVGPSQPTPVGSEPQRPLDDYPTARPTASPTTPTETPTETETGRSQVVGRSPTARRSSQVDERASSEQEAESVDPEEATPTRRRRHRDVPTEPLSPSEALRLAMQWNAEQEAASR